MSLYGYNYPWSGKLGGCAMCCLYCGRDDIHFQMSSRIGRCVSPECKRRKPIPRLLRAFEKESKRLAKKWCKERGIDFDATVKNFGRNLGPPLQEREGPIPIPDNYFELYTVYVSKAKQVKHKRFEPDAVL